ncbi:MAG TPA: hypothetical protein VHI99_23020 [Vicinamibacterales bacterium]|nr:hypothetical protein [Vicinamibacterales bacterium]
MTHQIRDAFYIATHGAVRQDGRIQIVSLDDVRAAHAEFMVLQEGRIQFHGNAQELLASQEPFLQEFPYRTLPPW